MAHKVLLYCISILFSVKQTATDFPNHYAHFWANVNLAKEENQNTKRKILGKWQIIAHVKMPGFDSGLYWWQAVASDDC